MPVLLSLRQHTALEIVQSQVLEGETYCVFLNDLSAVAVLNELSPSSSRFGVS